MAVANNEIALPNNIPDFSILKKQCYLKNWVVYCQKPFAGAEGIIRYLGNYTHRVAISNHRINSFENEKVTFSYILQHVLPCGFYKIRYFGILALCNLGSKMETCLNLIAKNNYLPVLEGLNAVEVWQIVSGKDLCNCPVCKIGKMRTILAIRPAILKPG